MVSGDDDALENRWHSFGHVQWTHNLQITLTSFFTQIHSRCTKQTFQRINVLLFFKVDPLKYSIMAIVMSVYSYLLLFQYIVVIITFYTNYSKKQFIILQDVFMLTHSYVKKIHKPHVKYNSTS